MSAYFDPNLEPIVWPERKVVFTFYHKTAGDDRFDGMIQQAFNEYKIVEDCSSLKEFLASNGVLITISVPESLHSQWQEDASKSTEEAYFRGIQETIEESPYASGLTPGELAALSGKETRASKFGTYTNHRKNKDDE